MRWMRVEKQTPKALEPLLLCVDNKIEVGFYHEQKYWPQSELDFVEPTHWCYLEDVPLPIKDCQSSCELCKNRHAAYHLAK